MFKFVGMKTWAKTIEKDWGRCSFFIYILVTVLPPMFRAAPKISKFRPGDHCIVVKAPHTAKTPEAKHKLHEAQA